MAKSAVEVNQRESLGKEKCPTSHLLSSLHLPNSILYHAASTPSIDMTTINIDMKSTLVLRGFLLLPTGIVFAFRMTQNNTRSRASNLNTNPLPSCLKFSSLQRRGVKRPRIPRRTMVWLNHTSSIFASASGFKLLLQFQLGVPHTHPPCSCQLWTHYALCVHGRIGVPRADQRAAEMRRAVTVSLSTSQDRSI